MQTSVLLPIKPIFADRIFDGTKLFEFRKRLFKNRDIKRIVVYATAPISKVIGEFEIEEILEDEIESLWEITKAHSGIPKPYFCNYFNGYEVGFAIKIGKTQRYKSPLKLQENFNIKYAPQSFIYLKY